MLTNKLDAFYQHVHAAILEVGTSAPRIAYRIISDAFPDTSKAAEIEGADRMLREGVINFLTQYLKRNSNAPIGTLDFSEIDEGFLPITSKLKNQSHYVVGLQQHMPVGFLIKNPKHLDDARKFKRQKGEETLAEAKVLDELYEAVTA
jgi:hypothetical protein